LEYKQLVKQAGGADKIDPETLKIMKSLFLSDINQIFSGLTTEILAGKQINTLIGASSLGKGVRQAAQKLQLPYRMAFQEMQKTGKLTPMRFQKIKDAYTEFALSMVEEVFGNSQIPEGLEKELENEEA
jgi:fumarylacetoacetate (FAA) hydrolase family protein